MLDDPGSRGAHVKDGSRGTLNGSVWFDVGAISDV